MDDRGFSILEVMIAVAVLAVGASVAASSMKTATSVSRASFEAEKVRDAILRARNLARFQLKCVTLDVQPRQMQITSWNTCSPGLADPQPPETIEFGESITLAAFSSGNPLTFNSFGGTGTAGPTTMVATSESGRPYVYTVMPAIGTVSVR